MTEIMQWDLRLLTCLRQRFCLNSSTSKRKWRTEEWNSSNGLRRTKKEDGSLQYPYIILKKRKVLYDGYAVFGIKPDGIMTKPRKYALNDPFGPKGYSRIEWKNVEYSVKDSSGQINRLCIINIHVSFYVVFQLFDLFIQFTFTTRLLFRSHLILQSLDFKIPFPAFFIDGYL